MSGIFFSGTVMLQQLKRFYIERIGCRVWLEQAACVILQHGNLLFGLCQRDEPDPGGLVTFFYETSEEVDRIHEALKNFADTTPSKNEKYDIYQFFARDPEGRRLEFQHFQHPVDKYLGGDELLLTRRSVRTFESKEVTDDVLKLVLDNCRYAPTSRNTQSYYFKVIRDKETIVRLAGVRGKSSGPIGQAPLAVAICSDPEISKRYVQDGCIAAYHFMLAAWYYGLGTCWIAAMDRDDVKEKLGVPANHYVATVTPLGYPRRPLPSCPKRKELSWFVRD